MTPTKLTRRVRCYDNTNTPQETADHFTIITTGRPWYCIFTSSNPTHSQGVWSCEETPRGPVDRDEPGRFGRRISSSKLPDAVIRTVNAYLREEGPEIC